jgi:4-amino-4-deoxy-L-arabinose transferase-like glycosyltransferase
VSAESSGAARAPAGPAEPFPERWRVGPGAAVGLAALAITLAFLGTRAIWDPDEGRYTNVAMNMLASGDWIHPMRSHEVGHWTKPPLTYWAIAASIGLLGANPFAARLPMALAQLVSIWATARCARRLAPGGESAAALIHATMLLPIAASQMVTTDALVACFQGLAMWAYVEHRFGGSERSGRWLWLFWSACAAAFLTKGPPALLVLLPCAALGWLAPSAGPRRPLRWIAGLLLFAGLALPWYLLVASENTELWAHFLGREVVERVAGSGYHRHPEWYGWAVVYGPTLLLGTLPWTAPLARWALQLPAAARGWRARAARQADAQALLLALWVLLPLAVFCVARSRVPLYLVPLAAPLAILAARQRLAEGRGLPKLAWIALWIALVLGLKLALANWPTHKDASIWATAIRARAPERVTEVVFVEDMARYGLRLHLGSEIEKVSLVPVPDAPIDPIYDEDLAQELAERESGAVWIAKAERWEEFRARVESLGYRPEPLGEPFEGRVIFLVHPAER